MASSRRRWAHVGPLLLLVAAWVAGAAEPRRVLVLQSLGRGFEPHETLSSAFRSALSADPSRPIELHEIYLETALYSGEEREAPFTGFLAGLEARRSLDLVVAIGGPAARFVQRHRDRIFTTTPLLIAGADHRHIARQALTSNDAAVAVNLDPVGAFANIFRVLPATTDVVIVLGNTPLEQFWVGEFRREFEPFASRARLTFWNELPYREILRRAAALPPGSAILYGQYVVDAEGAPHRDDAALTALRSVASAPLFGLFDYQLGRGILGGQLASPMEVGQQAAAVAVRILEGESPSRLRRAPIQPGAAAYDWRELERFRIDPARLPPGSTIRFRPPSFWEANRGFILGVSGIVGAQAALIAVLVVSLVGRRRAEERLRKSKEQYALAVEGANDGLWDWDIRSGDVYFSERCQNMLGHEDGGLPGRYESWEERIHPEDREDVTVALRSHLEGRTPAFRVEHRLRHEDGGYRWVLARGKAQRDAEGRAHRMAGSLTDITERKLGEEALLDVSRRLILAQEDERSRLARELHDDVTQRLARLAIDAARAEQGSPDAPPGETLRQVREGLVHLSEDVHALSYRLHPSLLEDLGLAEALRVECDRFGSISSVPVRLDLRDVPEKVLPGVAICLYRVAQEALRNVNRHARARSVELSLRGLDGGLQLAVRDDGTGFDPSVARAKRSLGHASMRERVHLLHGEFDIESAPGQGTTILAWVPLGEERA